MKLFVSVGTDMHRFDRLVDWADSWAQEHPDDEVLVQYGTSRVPRHADGVELLGRHEMRETLGSADLVIISCGPGGVMDARREGRLPVVVARRSGLHEHVDDHQIAFSEHLERVGLARSVATEHAFRDVIDEYRENSEHFSVTTDHSIPSGIAEVGRLIDHLVRSTH